MKRIIIGLSLLVSIVFAANIYQLFSYLEIKKKMKALEDGIQKSNKKVKSLDYDISQLQSDMEDANSRIDDNEGRIDDLENRHWTITIPNN